LNGSTSRKDALRLVVESITDDLRGERLGDEAFEHGDPEPIR